MLVAPCTVVVALPEWPPLEILTGPARVKVPLPPICPSLCVKVPFTVEAKSKVNDPPVKLKLSWLSRLTMVSVPLRCVIVRTVAPPTSIVTASAAPGSAGFELQLVTTSQKPSAFGTQFTGAASAIPGDNPMVIAIDSEENRSLVALAAMTGPSISMIYVAIQLVHHV